MAFASPQHKRGEINRAGDVLAGRRASTEAERKWAQAVLANFRGSHAYPINTFQALLRKKLKTVDPKALVAQRLKRAPSVLFKLQRYKDMQLARMQDIGGLRAVVGTLRSVRRLEQEYRHASFKHALVSSRDYITQPKADGYRSVHLIYRYRNPRAPAYAGLQLELQLRTKLQHAWATAVETMGTFLGQALKAGQGDKDWKEFFAAASAALALVEKSPPVPGYEGMSAESIIRRVADLESELRVLDKLSGFAIAADSIRKQSGQGAYHLVVLNSSARTVLIRPFALARLDEANAAYAAVEARASAGEPVEAVLVSAGPIDALQKAYPNYFLDTQAFVAQIRKLIKSRIAQL
jgi:putative GTP pyrophosphokinase